MKSINFQRNKSLIRVVNEKVKKKKQRNWDRILYLCLLGLFLLFLAYYFLFKFAYINAYGHVIIESTKIRLTDDARIINFKVHEGDSIQVNDTLFSYALDRDDDINGNSASQSISIGSIVGAKKDDWWVKEIFSIKKKIVLNNIDIAENEGLITTFKSEIKRLTNEVILDVLPKTRLDYVQNEILKLETLNKKLQKENNELYGLIKTLGPQVNSATYKSPRIYSSTGGGGSNMDDSQKLLFSEELLTEPKYFKSPVNGIATRIYAHDFETVLKTEDIISIHQSHPAYIKAFFEQEDLRYFKVGDEFNVTFPDGTTSVGVLKRFYIATYTLPEEFQKRYEPTTRSIAGDIYPKDSAEFVKWKTFYKMSVDISKLKFN